MQNQNETKQIFEWISAERPSEILPASVAGCIFEFSQVISRMMGELNITTTRENVLKLGGFNRIPTSTVGLSKVPNGIGWQM